MSFGTAPYQIEDHQVFINPTYAINHPNPVLDVVVYSTSPVTLSIHHLAVGVVSSSIDTYKHDGDDTYVSTALVEVSGSGSVTFKVNDHIIPTISWVQEGEVIKVTDFAGEVINLENGIWFEPETDDIQVKVKNLYRRVFFCTNKEEMSMIKEEIADLLGYDPDNGL